MELAIIKSAWQELAFEATDAMHGEPECGPLTDPFEGLTRGERRFAARVFACAVLALFALCFGPEIIGIG